jgi:uncharacterized protein YndB with AHSA1/START domain
MLIGIVALCLLVAFVVVTGYVLPVAHTASREARLEPGPERVFDLLADVEAYPRWRSDVRSVDVLSRDSPRRWAEHGSNGDITFEVAESHPPLRLISRIADRSLPFGGTWTYELEREGTGTRLTVTERGEVFNPVFRFMSRFIFGHTATIDRFLRDLQRAR